MTNRDLIVTTLVGLVYGAAVAGVLWVGGVTMPDYAWAAVVCWVAAAMVCARYAEPAEPWHWMRR